MGATTALQFGAGNVGRGFLGQLFWESGLEVVFVDVNQNLVAQLNQRRSYPLSLIEVQASQEGGGLRQLVISPVSALHTDQKEQIAEEIARAAVACTAVGAAALPHLGPLLAAGLQRRYLEGGPPLNILLCENLLHAEQVLREAVAAHLPTDQKEAILARTGFAPAVVGRMIPLLSPEERAADPLLVRAESYHRLPVDKRALVGDLPPIAGVEPVENFWAHMERKLYSHNAAHAALGYLGWLAGYTYAAEALADEHIKGRVRGLMEETGQALVKQHGFSPQEQRAYEEDLLVRMAHPALKDTCDRLARDPLRKLAPEDRLVGAARLCLSQQVFPHNVAHAIAAALRYANLEDVSAKTMQESINIVGIQTFLKEHCQIDPSEPLGKAVLHHYYAFAAKGETNHGV